MALTATDLLQPVGRLTASMFPADVSATLSTRLAQYLAQGYAAAAGLSGPALDGAAVAYAYALAWEAVHDRLVAAPMTASFEGDGSHAFQWNQVDAAAKKAREWRDVFDTAVGALYAVLPTEPASAPATVPVRFRLF